MDVTYAQWTGQGPVRGNNEDYLGYFCPAQEDERRERGAVAIIADGVGGQGDGEIASRMAVETALKWFQETKAGTSLNGVLWQMINHANLTVYDAGMERRSTEEARMATTLTCTVFRNDQLGIGHVGDCRTYLIHGNTIKCLTTDHTHIAFHQRMGLFTGADLTGSPLRGLLARSVGKDPVVPIDFYYATVVAGDYVVQCTDGVHTLVSDNDILEMVLHQPPAEGVQKLAGLCLARGPEDNFSVQVVRIEKVQMLSFYRGNPMYTETRESMSHEIQVGDVLDDRFEIAEVIGRSGMASIFKAMDRETGKFVAVKVPFLEYESDPAFYSRFEREEEIGRMMDHPAILHLVPLDRSKRSRPYIAMELLKGRTLDRVLRDRAPMEESEAVGIIAKLCDAVAHMHAKGVVHRDLKPQNIMMCDDGSLRIVDFGIAKAAGMRRMTFTGFSPAMGTPDFMAPEQVKGRRGDERTDVYSLGAMLYEMLTGKAPFDGPNPFVVMHARVVGDPKALRRIRPDLSPEVEEIVLHAMAREPAERYASAAALKKDLDAPREVEVTGRAAHLQQPRMWKARWRRIWRLGLLVAVPLVIFTALYLIFHGR